MTLVLVILACAAVIASATLYLALSPTVHYGVLGTTGLALISLGSTARVSQLIDRCLAEEWACGVSIRPTLLIWIGLALFFGRLMVRHFQARGR